MIYQLYYKRDRTEKRAPSKISIKLAYEMGGEVEASSRAEAARKWYQGKDIDDDSISKPEVGDVLMDALGDCYILTPQGLWAKVSLKE